LRGQRKLIESPSEAPLHQVMQTRSIANTQVPATPHQPVLHPRATHQSIHRGQTFGGPFPDMQGVSPSSNAYEEQSHALENQHSRSYNVQAPGLPMMSPPTRSSTGNFVRPMTKSNMNATRRDSLAQSGVLRDTQTKRVLPCTSQPDVPSKGGSTSGTSSIAQEYHKAQTNLNSKATRRPNVEAPFDEEATTTTKRKNLKAAQSQKRQSHLTTRRAKRSRTKTLPRRKARRKRKKPGPERVPTAASNQKQKKGSSQDLDPPNSTSQSTSKRPNKTGSSISESRHEHFRFPSLDLS
jgi:hypothetical protein